MIKLNIRSGSIIVLLISILYSFSTQGQNANIQKIHTFLETVLDSFPGVPGINLVVVNEDGILFYESAGYAVMEASTRFTAETGMYIASNTKAFVGLALAKLVSDGQVSADAPITKYINRKFFPDSIDVNQIYVRDLPGHTHGLSNDAMTFRTAFTGTAPDSLLPELLQFTSYSSTPPSKNFRYNNFSYLLIGMIIQNVTGLSWRTYLTDNILNKANLTNTSPYFSDYKNKELASPYLFNQPGHKISVKKQDNTMHAAGGLVSTSRDMAEWLQLFINDGSDGEQQFINPEYIRLAKNVGGRYRPNGPFQRYGYAWGWLVGNFNDESFYFHFGNYSGLGCMMSFMPEQKTGVFVFVNVGVAGLYLSALVTTYVYNQLLGKENEPEITAMIMKMVNKTFAETEGNSLIIAPEKSLPFHLPGQFVSDPYGDLDISVKNDSVMAQMGNLFSPLYQGDSTNHFILQWVPGDHENIWIKQNDSELEIQYEDFTTFRKR
ncbi:MAG: serine hydrolase domain-containing protein [Bacteroidales bacterium]